MITVTLLWMLWAQAQEATVPADPWFDEQIVVSFNAVDMMLPELLREIGREYDVDFVIESGNYEKISIKLENQKLNDFLSMLQRLEHLRIEKIGGIVYIRPPLPPQPELPKNEFQWDAEQGTLGFDLEQITLSDFARKITELTGINMVLLEPGIGNRNIKAYQAPLPLAQAINILLRTLQLKLNEEDGVFFVGNAPPQPLEQGADPQTARSGNVQNQRPDGTKLNNALVIEDGLISAHYSNTSRQKILDDLIAAGDFAILIQTALTENISLDVKNVEFEHFLSLLLSGSNAGFVKQRDVVIVSAKDADILIDSVVVRLKYVSAEMMLEMIPKDFSGTEVKISAVKELNGLLVNGPSRKTRAVVDLINELDKPVPQVLIEVMVVDYNFTKDSDIGVSITNGDNLIFPELDLTLDGFRGEDGDFQVRRLPSNFSMRLRALETTGNARIISKPHIAALNGNKASITIGTTQYYKITKETLVGDDTPRVSTSQEIKEIDANIFLEIQPWVTGNGEVTTIIKPEFKTFLGQIVDNVPPPVSTRQLESTVRLKDGETIILGGLIQDFDSLNLQGVPFISRIPLLGALFRNRSSNNQQSELVIYITPHIYYGDEGSVEFIREREGLDYPLDVRKQRDGRKAKNPKKKNWFRRNFGGESQKRKSEQPTQIEQPSASDPTDENDPPTDLPEGS